MSVTEAAATASAADAILGIEGRRLEYMRSLLPHLIQQLVLLVLDRLVLL